MELIGATLAGMANGKYKIIVGLYKQDYKDCKTLVSEDCESIEEIELRLKDISRKIVIESFVFIYGEFTDTHIVKDGFDFYRDGPLVLNKFEKLVEKQKSKQELLTNSLEDLNKKFDSIDTKLVYQELINILKIYYPVMVKEPIPEALQAETDRDFLDLSIEMFSLLYAKVHNLEYGENIYPKEVENHPFMIKLLKYKMKHYGKEIFKSLGMEIVGTSKDGHIIREEIPTSNKIN